MQLKRIALLIVLLGISFSAVAQEHSKAITFEQVVDRAIASEGKFVNTLQNYSPIVETYIQNLQLDKSLGPVPKSDEYFLGRLKFDQRIEEKSFVGQKNESFFGRTFGKLTHLAKVDFLPLGFAQMVLLDGQGFDHSHYDFKFVRREFLGDVRTVVIDVTPKPKSGIGRFLGRIWVEDRDFNIVRFNGTYAPAKKGTYLHFDSWRLNMAPGLWLPAYIYSEESDLKVSAFQQLRFKSQTRLWGYNAATIKKESEFSQIIVDSADAVKDQSQSVQDLSPVSSQRAWERQAEDNVIDRLQRASLLDAPGEVDNVLQTVVNNLEITNNLTVEPEIRCRVMMTTPMETYTVGRTIVVSRGLLDVLPDEATLAVLLAHEMAHIVLGHQFDTKYAFSDRMLFADELTFNQFDFERDPADEAAADEKAEELIQNSPYKDKLLTAGLFFRQLADRRSALQALIRSHLGNGIADKNLGADGLATNATQLDPNNVSQVPALPLGGRIRVDPFDNKLEISKNKPVALQSAREKMPFEVTPLFPYLRRLDTALPQTSGD